MLEPEVTSEQCFPDFTVPTDQLENLLKHKRFGHPHRILSWGAGVESERSVAGKRIPQAEGIKDQKTSESAETVAVMANPLAPSRRKGAQRNRLAQ